MGRAMRWTGIHSVKEETSTKNIVLALPPDSWVFTGFDFCSFVKCKRDPGCTADLLMSRRYAEPPPARSVSLSLVLRRNYSWLN